MNLKPNDKIRKGTIVRLMSKQPYKILEDTTAHSKTLMIRVNEDYSEISEEDEIYCYLMLDEVYGEGEDHQSILYDPFFEIEQEFLSREKISRFEIMEL